MHPVMWWKTKFWTKFKPDTLGVNSAHPASDRPDMQASRHPEDWCAHRFGLSAERWAHLAGRNFWVTGAGTGYGQCISLALAAAGGRVYLTGRRETKLQETVAEGCRLGIDTSLLVPLVADITSPESVNRIVAEMASYDEPLFGLVNNAALPQGGKYQYPLLNASWDEWRALILTNVDAQWLVTQQALPLMLKGNGGRVVFMTSEAGWAFTPGFGIYNVSKAAMNNLAASFAAECEAAYPDRDFQINALVPGEARTEMNQGSSVSPYTVVEMMLILLSYPRGGPNGCFFHQDGRNLQFAYAEPYSQSLLRSARLNERPK
ncbi:MAG: SDR family oxidoreductase [Candidatus Thiosymbion ectosymbiont of Robbea hypermnestra]|nr:SDR family oxidoreductase [Candidatus Thiosymbion ectosymbiont of Robbea hypermnestra]